MAGQWFALPKLFKASKNEGYEVVRSDDEVLQFKNEQVRLSLPTAPRFLVADAESGVVMDIQNHPKDSNNQCSGYPQP